MCGSSHQINITTLNLTRGGELNIGACPDYQKCYNATYKFDKTDGEKTYKGDGFIRSCVNTTSCADLFAYGKSQVEKDNTTKMTAGNGFCCDGDFCNIGNVVPKPAGSYTCFLYLLLQFVNALIGGPKGELFNDNSTNYRTIFSPRHWQKLKTLPK